MPAEEKDSRIFYLLAPFVLLLPILAVVVLTQSGLSVDKLPDYLKAPAFTTIFGMLLGFIVSAGPIRRGKFKSALIRIAIIMVSFCIVGAILGVLGVL